MEEAETPLDPRDCAFVVLRDLRVKTPFVGSPWISMPSIVESSSEQILGDTVLKIKRDAGRMAFANGVRRRLGG